MEIRVVRLNNEETGAPTTEGHDEATGVFTAKDLHGEG
jgi:hypothetical protein